MGTVSLYTFVAGSVPTASQFNQNPVAIAAVVNGEIDEANIQTTDADGVVGMSVTQTTANSNPITGNKTFSGQIEHRVTFSKPIKIGTTNQVFLWYDETNTTLRVKHGSTPSNETDGNVILEG